MPATILGTPAEEGGNGKGYMMDKGAMKTIDCSMMAHPFPFNSSCASNFVASSV